MIPIDKQAHFWAGAAIAGLLAAYGIHPFWAFLIAVAAGWAKEFIDKHRNGTPDKVDFLVTALGAILALPAMFL